MENTEVVMKRQFPCFLCQNYFKLSRGNIRTYAQSVDKMWITYKSVHIITTDS